MSAVLAIICVASTVSCSLEPEQEEVDMGDTQPLVELGEVPNQIPALEVDGVGIDHYMIDWVSPAEKRALNSDGTLPSQEIESTDQHLEMNISTPALPLSLSILIFHGSLATVDPMSDPAYSFDCLSENGACVNVVKDNSLQLSIPTTELPEDYVVSIFAEYYRDPNFDTQTGSTNLVGWAFGVIKR